MAEYKIAYPVKVHRPPWRDGPACTIIDANGCEVAHEIENAFADIIVADMNAAEEQRLLNKIFAKVPTPPTPKEAAIPRGYFHCQGCKKVVRMRHRCPGPRRYRRNLEIQREWGSEYNWRHESPR